MNETVTVKLPRITAVSIAPNPVNAGATYLLAVTAAIMDVELLIDTKYSGESYAGE